MPTVKVFYAWQAYRSQRCHRRLIRDAARDACERITLVRSNNFKVTLEEAAVVVPGMCDVPNSTLRKIDDCDLMLADLTFVATTDELDRETKIAGKLSDPTVLLQLGYAARSKGASRLVGVKNEIDGGPSDQLLDVRRRWIVSYSLAPTETDKRTIYRAQKMLSRKLEGVLLTAMHQQDEIDSKPPTDRRFLEVRSQFETDIIGGTMPLMEDQPAAVAVTIMPAKPIDIQPERIAEVMNAADIPFDELHSGPQSVAGFTAESTIDVTASGVLRAVLTENLNVQRAGFPLPPGAAGMIPSNTLERNVILAVHRCCQLLHKLKVRRPWQMGISLLNIHEFTMVVGPGERSDVFDRRELSTDPLIITDFETVESPENVARFLKGTFDSVWREFGLGYSRNYDIEGNWNRNVMD
jgi:hypothetical protein